jgi:hypothetical protein
VTLVEESATAWTSGHQSPGESTANAKKRGGRPVTTHWLKEPATYAADRGEEMLAARSGWAYDVLTLTPPPTEAPMAPHWDGVRSFAEEVVGKTKKDIH